MPARIADSVPACRSKLAVEESVPLRTVPPVRVKAAAVCVVPPRSSVPAETCQAIIAPGAWLTVQVPVPDFSRVPKP